MKMLSGTLKETQFHWPKEGEEEQTQLQQKAVHNYKTNEVTYINGEDTYMYMYMYVACTVIRCGKVGTFCGVPYTNPKPHP